MIRGYMYVLHTLAQHGKQQQHDSRHAQNKAVTGVTTGGLLCRTTTGLNTKSQPITMGDFSDLTGCGDAERTVRKRRRKRRSKGERRRRES